VSLAARLRAFCGRPAGAALLLALLGLATFLGRQHDGGLRSFDDAYYAQKAVEQLAAGGSWVSTHGGQARYDNPPLHFWATALGYRAFGVSRFTALLVTGLAATGTLLLTFALGRRLLAGVAGAGAGAASRQGPGLTAALILLLPGFFMDYARRGMLDQTLVLCFTAGLAALWQAQASAAPRRRGLWLAVFGLALGGALLTKSVIGALLLPVAFVWLLAAGRPLTRGFWAACLLGLALFALWVWRNAQHGGQGFWDEHFGWLIFGRAVRDAGEPGPWFWLGYLKRLGGNFWPWLPFALLGGGLAWRAWRRERSAAGALLLAWVLVPLVVMSLTRNQFLRYLLNIFPALALLAAWGLAQLLARRGWLGRLNAGLVLLALGAAAVINFTSYAPPGAVGLAPQSVEVVALAPAIRAGTPPGVSLLNFGLGTWDPRNALLFHAERWLADPVADPHAFTDSLLCEPGRGFLTSAAGAALLDSVAPGLLIERGRAGALVYGVAAGD
jgi:4-amino-4-deoxy-L-arabinose transferase-like glycosyltransferase